ncbi:hypothetical protein B0H13DRAFT_1933793 [Mycena leptocephala]|nr:hypothetical protein B0H13DRAFT_1933793 [Mycena leptocephala]
MSDSTQSPETTGPRATVTIYSIHHLPPTCPLRVGTDIGDVGVGTSDGAFDVIFNICRSADDPVTCQMSLKLKAAQVGSSGTSFLWERETADSFEDLGPRPLPADAKHTENQTLFLRGFKVAITSSPLTLKESRNGDLDLVNEESFDASDEYFPANPKKNYHLASVINDDAWVSVPNENEEQFPDDSELIRRIFDEYYIDTSSGEKGKHACREIIMQHKSADVRASPEWMICQNQGGRTWNPQGKGADGSPGNTARMQTRDRGKYEFESYSKHSYAGTH